MDGHVPIAPECVRIVSIPPISIEVPISKVKYLAREVEKRVKEQVEKDEPDQVIGDLEMVKIKMHRLGSEKD